jgi:rhodanese-related sulfurtransferase
MILRVAVILEQQQFLEAVQKVVFVADVLPPAQCDRGHMIGAGRTPDSEVNAARKQRLQHLEALRDGQRRVVGQHHAARPDPHVSCRGGDLPDHDVGRGTCDICEIVVLRKPVTAIAKSVRVAREIDAVAERLRCRTSGRDRREIEN